MQEEHSGDDEPDDLIGHTVSLRLELAVAESGDQPSNGFKLNCAGYSRTRIFGLHPASGSAIGGVTSPITWLFNEAGPPSSNQTFLTLNTKYL
jgi:hypothetical protein